MPRSIYINLDLADIFEHLASTTAGNTKPMALGFTLGAGLSHIAVSSPYPNGSSHCPHHCAVTLLFSLLLRSYDDASNRCMAHETLPYL
ncbi:hypothetical protein BDN70DRAFT_939526 [Pholiota conissans]|uniref:Uncharacterized protein n=1 Tax=Pholiota conissans TaxID=109636 RepID=A0A9P5YMR5_9AGAR|nr:hypothetical protein BDN70DRAFT_939526 [Pholiota conissans]